MYTGNENAAYDRSMKEFKATVRPQTTVDAPFSTPTQATPVVGEIFSFDEDTPAGEIFVSLLIPCALLVAVVMAVYGTFRGTQHLVSVIREKVGGAQTSTPYINMDIGDGPTNTTENKL
ncbi:uncharacterized protein [Diadema setosum]|uniref:uncharacterized protein n=1 Tax=Diadema setosum TaxID=31175 RepID=UPI003B3ABD08